MHGVLSFVDHSLGAVVVVHYLLRVVAIGGHRALFGELAAQDGEVMVVDVGLDWDRGALYVHPETFWT